MAISARKTAIRSRKKNVKSKLYGAKSVAASRLRQRKHQLARRFEIPHYLLGGSLNQVFRKCGKPTCRCASGEGHPMWTLTYSVNGRRHVEFLPDELIGDVAPMLEEGRAYRDALVEIRAINAQLVTLWRKQQRSSKRNRRPKKR